MCYEVNLFSKGGKGVLFVILFTFFYLIYLYIYIIMYQRGINFYLSHLF
jgi:hypothetical protein